MENYQSEEETQDYDANALMRDVYDHLQEEEYEDEEEEEEYDEEESVAPEDFEADPEEEEEEAATTTAFEAKHRDNVPNPVLPPAPQPRAPQVHAPQINQPHGFPLNDPATLQLARSDAISDDETVDPEYDPKKLSIVNPSLRNRKNASASIKLARQKLANQDSVIANLQLQLEDARHIRTSLQSKLNYAKKHHKSTTSKFKAQQTYNLKVADVKLKQRDKKIKYAHIDGVCDGIKYNNQRCVKLSRGFVMRQGKRCDYCTEHETKIKFPNSI
jgi:hypothetical protein